jgi:hypothetical protein
MSDDLKKALAVALAAKKDGKNVSDELINIIETLLTRVLALENA